MEFGPGEDLAIAEAGRRIRIGPGTSVAELGGGGGSFLLPFAALGCECHAIDFSSVGLTQASRRFADAGYPVMTHLADMFALPSALFSSFDLVVSYGVCEHFRGDKRQNCFAAHSALLKPGGVAMASVPNRWSPFYQLWTKVARLLSAAGLKRRLDINQMPEWAFSRNELIALLTEAGLQDIVVFGAPIIGDAVDLLARPAQKTMLRALGRTYTRRPRIRAGRTSVDGAFGSYFYAVGTRPAATSVAGSA